MHSAIFAATLVASALAIPHKHAANHANKRNDFTTYDVVVVTDIAVVTVTGAAPASTPIATTTQVEAVASPSSAPWWWGWHHSQASYSSTPYTAPAPATTKAPSSIAAPSTSAASTPAPPPSTYQAPAPASSSVSTSSSQAPASTVAPSSTISADLSSYSGVVVAHHNLHRANHSADPLQWDDGLAATAASIASNCYYAHNVTAGGGGYGQNIAAGVEANNISAIITDLFYNGEVGWYAGLYTQAQPSMANFEHWGHFSQIVWKATTHVGCATQDCSAQGLGNVGTDVSPYFTVCNYKDPGNYANEYGTNVGSPLNQPTAQWDTLAYVGSS
ncbi:hypothetical protein LTR62_000943 [Meristemomyces frigidus]|uniref:SCP domain-containing protein n=1 Tax=Meristemomyces frigidus TaxID=1508187 RepID=A0AAN7YLC4_9PEZI|nr:hypothetical protein LTR62_000943 [Meristemomyces frigidus]